jgi:hypothetical protein
MASENSIGGVSGQLETSATSPGSNLHRQSSDIWLNGFMAAEHWILRINMSKALTILQKGYRQGRFARL